jgi:hypothetical protein
MKQASVSSAIRGGGKRRSGLSIIALSLTSDCKPRKAKATNAWQDRRLWQRGRLFSCMETLPHDQAAPLWEAAQTEAAAILCCTHEVPRQV